MKTFRRIILYTAAFCGILGIACIVAAFVFGLSWSEFIHSSIVLLQI